MKPWRRAAPVRPDPNLAFLYSLQPRAGRCATAEPRRGDAPASRDAAVRRPREPAMRVDEPNGPMSGLEVREWSVAVTAAPGDGAAERRVGDTDNERD